MLTTTPVLLQDPIMARASSVMRYIAGKLTVHVDLY